MKALAKTKPAPGLELIDAPIPTPGDDEILVKVKYASICGSDLHAYNWDPWAQEEITEFPRILGHEVAGEIVEVGKNAKGVKVGDFVAFESHIWCGECYQCRLGEFHICQNMKILGFQVDGGFAEYMKINWKNAIKLPPEIPPHWAPVMEPMGNAVDTVYAEDVATKDVLITGMGPIGLMAVAIAKASGANMVIATDVKEKRLELAKKMGADHVINPKETNLYEYVMDITGGKGVDVMLEMSGNEHGFKDGIKTLRAGGRLSMLGLFPEEFKFDFNDYFIMKNLRIYAILGRHIYSTWFRTINLLASGQVNLDPIITKITTLDDYQNAFEELKKGEHAKVVFKISD